MLLPAGLVAWIEATMASNKATTEEFYKIHGCLSGLEGRKKVQKKKINMSTIMGQVIIEIKLVNSVGRTQPITFILSIEL